ncbi:hypothetical protein [uncultured Pontibacter sp.]|uniref:hypothetical protein n=1 Tax=uncultured Pontibacter sp. TaxID=453356 RepID=UPI0026115DF4|nr:hypothetical protein [uncultured Pontibacter sp.]
MILFRNHLIELDYATAQDILYATWQERKSYNVEEVKNGLKQILGSAKEHKIKRVLLNFSNNIKALSHQEYALIIAQLKEGLQPTPIQKLACVGPNEKEREEKVDSPFQANKGSIDLQMELKFFPNRALALHWLMS